MILKKIIGFSSLLLSTVLFSSFSQADVFELRTYTTPDGRLDALLARFEDDTMRIFEKHHMTNIGYWVPQDKPNTLIYMVSHADKEAAAANWQGFISDPEWAAVAEASQIDGPIVTRVESIMMSSLSWSPIH